MKNRYVKVENYSEWFFILEPNQELPSDFKINTHERILRSEVYTLHGGEKVPTDFFDSIKLRMLKTPINYEQHTEEFGTILIRYNGSFMPMDDLKIVEESDSFGSYFPIDEDLLAYVVICENDKEADSELISGLQECYPNKTISTINFFDLRSNEEIKEIFNKAKIITFSTTFSNYEWFKKLTRNMNDTHEVYGLCNDESKWNEALKINPRLKINKLI